MRAEVCTVLLSFAIGASSGGAAKADDAAAQSLLAAHRGAIVQLLVKGKVNDQPSIEYGTGFLMQTAAGPRILTAGHVIGPDSKWDSLTDRCIYYRLAKDGSSQAYDCVIDARIASNVDLAEVYLDPFNPPVLGMAPSVPPVGSDLAVASWRSWGQPGSRATAQWARVLKVAADNFTVSGNYERSDSGSPVLDSQGRVVGLMTDAAAQPGGTTIGTVLPVTAFADLLGNAVAIKKTVPRALAQVAHNQIIVDAIAIASEAGCVFLGKRSARVTHKPEDMPFGAGMIETLNSDDGRKSLIAKRLPVETTVNLRRDCPTIIEGSAYYAAVAARLAPGDTMLPDEILALRYLDDTFYWARGHGLATASAPRYDLK